MTAKKTKALAKTGTNQVDVSGYRGAAGKGFENTDPDSFATPRLYMLHELSSQCKKKGENYVEGAEAGMIFNTVANTVHDELSIVPILFYRNWVEWVPREDGGGFVAEHTVLDPSWKRQDRGPMLAESGNIINDTRNFFVVILSKDNAPTPAVISMTASQIKIAKNWVSLLAARMGEDAQGKFQLPFYATVWNIKGKFTSNDKGDWHSWNPKDTHEFVPPGSDLFKQAEDLHTQFQAGRIRVAEPEAPLSSDSDGDTAF